MIGIGIVLIDITEREEADRLRAAVMDTMVEGLYVLDGDGRLTLHPVYGEPGALNAAPTR